MEHIMRVVYQHYRVPLFLLEMIGVSLGRDLVKGQPSDEVLFHYRKGVDTWTPAERGGKTVCTITSSNGLRYVGVAYCSLADEFNYSTGRGLAYERASLDWQVGLPGAAGSQEVQ